MKTILGLVLFVLACGGSSANSPAPAVARTGPGCYVGGCSSEVCSETEGVITNCIAKAEYKCYQQARCEKQPDGKCGWTKTPELEKCLATPPK